jgi:MFS family permease
MLQQSDSHLKTPILSHSHSHNPPRSTNRVDPPNKSVSKVTPIAAKPPSDLPLRPGISNGKKDNAQESQSEETLVSLSAQTDAVSLPVPPAEPKLKELANGRVNGSTAYADTNQSPNSLESNTSLLPPREINLNLPPQEPVIDSQETTSEQGFLPVLRNRNFLSLWSGQVFSQLADKVYLVLMIALIDTHFHSGSQTISAWVSAIMIAFTIPAVLFGSLAGVFVDRWSKKAVLVATNLLRGGLVIALPLLLWLAQGWGSIAGLPAGFCLLLLVTFLVSTLTQFFAPAEQATIPLIVEKRHLLSANSLYTTTMMASVIVGFAVGQPVLDLADTLLAGLGAGNGKEFIVGGSYAIAGLFLLLLQTHEDTTIEHEPPHVLADLRDGLRYLKRQRRVRTALMQLVILFSIFAALSVLAVRLAEIIPGLKSSQFGFLMAAGGLGLGLGAAILGHFGERVCHIWLSLVGSLGVAAALTGLALLPHQLWLVLLLVTCMGGFGALVAVPMQTTIQKETPSDMRGKVFGLQNNGINIALTLPLALAGVAETLFGLQAVFLGLAAAAIAGGLLTWYICRTSSNQFTKADQSNC